MRPPFQTPPPESLDVVLSRELRGSSSFHKSLRNALRAQALRSRRRSNYLLIGTDPALLSAMLGAACNAAGLPFVERDAGACEDPGPRFAYMLLRGLVDSAGQDMDHAERGVVFLSGLDQATPAVREEALRLARGTNVVLARGDVEVLDTSGVLFIACTRPAGTAVGFTKRTHRTNGKAAFADVFQIVREAPPLTIDSARLFLETNAASPLRFVESALDAGEVRFTRGAVAHLAARLADPRGKGLHGVVATLHDRLDGLVAATADGAATIVIDQGVIEDGSPPRVVPRDEPTPLPATDTSYAPRLARRPPRPAGTVCPNGGRLARATDFEGLTPHDERPFVLGGITPIVETVRDGSRLGTIAERDLAVPLQFPLHHMLGVGKTGAGKTTKFVLRALHAAIRVPEASIVLVETKGDQWPAALAMTREVRGPKAEFLYFNPATPSRSVVLNPFQDIRDRGDALRVATAITHATPIGRSDSPFFRNAATKLLTELIVTLKDGTCDPASVATLVDGGVGEMMKFARNRGYAKLLATLQFIGSGSNGSTTLQELANYLLPFMFKGVRRVTSGIGVSWAQLDEQPSVLVLHVPQDDIKTTQSLLCTLLDRFFSHVMGRPAGSRPVFLLIDELAALGHLTSLPHRISVCRSAGCGVIAACQTLAQLRQHYGDKASELIAGFNSLVAFPPVAEPDASEISGLTGTMRTLIATSEDGFKPSHVRCEGRPLLTADEITRPRHEPLFGPPATFLLKGMPVFQGYVRPVWADEQLARFLVDEATALRMLPSPVLSALPLKVRELLEDWPDQWPWEAA